MSGQPWETHDPLCPNRRPAIAFPNSACSGCRVAAARAESQDGDDFWPSRVRHAEERGFKAGVKAAREAIRNTPTDPRWNILQIERSFLAAIDGVKGEQA